MSCSNSHSTICQIRRVHVKENSNQGFNLFKLPVDRIGLDSQVSNLVLYVEKLITEEIFIWEIYRLLSPFIYNMHMYF